MAKLKREFTLNPDQPKSLVVEVSASALTGKLKDMVVMHQGKAVGQAATDKEIRNGITIDLPGYGVLKARVVRKAFGGDQIQIRLNDKPLGRTERDRKDIAKDAMWALYFIGGLSILIGSASELFTHVTQPTGQAAIQEVR